MSDSVTKSEELAKLEELFRSGFILEDEFNKRKNDLTSDDAAAPTPASAPCGAASCDHKHDSAQHGEEDSDEDDEDYEDEETFWECDQCSKEILGARFHCFHCGESDTGFDLCRSCRTAGMAAHTPGHRFQTVGPYDVVLDTEKELILTARLASVTKVRVLRPYEGVTEFQMSLGPKRILFGTTGPIEKILAELPQTLEVVHVSEDESAREVAEREQYATQLLESTPYTALELDLVSRTLDITPDEAAAELKEANGDLALLLGEDGEDEDEEEDH